MSDSEPRPETPSPKKDPPKPALKNPKAPGEPTTDTPGQSIEAGGVD